MPISKSADLNATYILLAPEARNGASDTLHYLGADAERLLQNCTWNSKLEQLVCSHKKPGVLRVQSIKCDGGFIPDIDLEMLGRSREEREVACVQCGSIQHVVVTDKACVDRPLHHKQRLRRERVRVGWDDAADVKVESDVRDALRVERWEFIHRRECWRRICASDGRIVSWSCMETTSWAKCHKATKSHEEPIIPIVADLKLLSNSHRWLRADQIPVNINLVTFPGISLLYQLTGLYIIWITYSLA